MNVFLLALLCIAVISGAVFGVFMTGEKPIMTFPREHYSIEITGLSETYFVGEPYSFSYTLYGFGDPCGGTLVTFPINKTNNVSTGSIPSCAKTIQTDFVLDVKKTYGTTYGHIDLQETGVYTVRVEFEKGVGGPTVAEKSFTVINP